ncbi:MAG: RNA polymerase sigma factor [Planctomycetota bacterium]
MCPEPSAPDRGDILASQTNPDEELIRRAASGDQDAFFALYEKYKGRIHRFARRMLNDDDLAGDVVQDTFEYFFRKIPVFRFEAKTDTLLFKAARNRALNLLEKGRRRAAVSLENAGDLTDPGAGDPAATASEEDFSRLTVRTLDLLSEDHREVIVLKIMKGLSYDEIGAVLDVPAGTVKSRLHGALEAMRKKMKGRRTLDPRTG